MSVHGVCDVVLMFKFLSGHGRSERTSIPARPVSSRTLCGGSRVGRSSDRATRAAADTAVTGDGCATVDGNRHLEWNRGAESDATIIVEGNHYFPSTSVRTEHLRRSTHSSVPLERDSERLRRGRG